MLVAAVILRAALRRDRRRSSARPAMPTTSCASRPRCWCSAWRWRWSCWSAASTCPSARWCSPPRRSPASCSPKGSTRSSPSLAAIGIGAAVGLLNAALIEGLRISPVIVTLGTMIAVRGLSLVALGHYNSWVEIKRAALRRPRAPDRARHPARRDRRARRLPAIVWFVLARTILGRAWHAAGDAPVAARLAGLRVRRLRARRLCRLRRARRAPPACWSRRAPG